MGGGNFRPPSPVMLILLAIPMNITFWKCFVSCLATNYSSNTERVTLAIGYFVPF